MRLPLEIVIRNVVLSAPLRAEIEERAGKLDQFYDRIMRCRVTAEGPGRHHRKGFFTLRLDITVPGKKIVVARQAGEEPREAIREAFDAAGRRIEDHIRRARHFVKTHEDATEARVARIFPERGFGFLETRDGREIYFHEHSVLHGAFSRLRPGSMVRYAEEPGEDGPQATTVTPMWRTRIRRSS
jgi:cold shock CspA family protein